MTRFLLKCAVGCGAAIGTYGMPSVFASDERRSRPLRAVIVGGGCAGSILAKTIEHSMATTLIDKKSFFEFTPALKQHLLGKAPDDSDPDSILESEKDYFRKYFIPHGYYLRYSDVIVGEAKEITKTHVLLNNGKKIAYDRCFICTGSNQASPWRQSTTQSVPDRAIEMNHYRKLINASNNIAIIGGGASGCEYAGHINSIHPDKSVTIYHSRQSLAPSHGKRVQQYIKKHFLRRNTTLNRLCKVTNVSFNEDTKKFTIDWKYSNEKENPNKGIGEVIDDRVGGTDGGYDYVFDCRGIIPATQILEKNFKSSLSEDGFARVDEENRLIGARNIYALGDIALHSGPQGKESGLAFVVDDVLRVASKYLNALSGRNMAINSNKLYDTTFPTQFIQLNSNTFTGYSAGSGQLTSLAKWVAGNNEIDFLNSHTSPAFVAKLKTSEISTMRRILEVQDKEATEEGKDL